MSPNCARRFALRPPSIPPAGDSPAVDPLTATWRICVNEGSTMARFTFIVDYDNGLMISGVHGRDVVAALRRWMKEYPSATIPRMEQVSKRALVAEFAEKAAEPVLVKNQGRVWCYSGLINDKLMLIYAIETVFGQSSVGQRKTRSSLIQPLERRRPRGSTRH